MNITSKAPSSPPKSPAADASDASARIGQASAAAPAGAARDVFVSNDAAPIDTTSAVTSAELFRKVGADASHLPTARRRFAQNVQRLVAGVGMRTRELVEYTASLSQALGHMALECTTLDDLRQLQDFALLAIKNGQPQEVWNAFADIFGYVFKHPDEARDILRFIAKAEKQTFAQKTAWTQAATSSLQGVKGVADKAPAKKADVVIIGGGLSAGHAIRYFAKAFKEGDAKPLDVLVIERDEKSTREHAASLRNAGMVCTVLDNLTDISEAIGEAPITHIQETLKISRPEAERAYQSLMHVMGKAVDRVREFLAERRVDIEFDAKGALDLAKSKEDMAAFRKAAELAQELGIDWRVIDAEVLAERHGIKSDGIEGALVFAGNGQVHPGKLVKALFDAAQKDGKNIRVQYETELLQARPNDAGDGWILETNRGLIHAKDVIDAREAFAPYRFREARYSQIHILDVGDDPAIEKLGATNIDSGYTYMRNPGAGKFLVGSGDVPVRHADKPPRPLGSIALYAAACFKKALPDTPYDIERVWGGVFGVNSDELPTAGELLKGWHVLGGAAGVGLSLTPAMAEQAVDHILGHAERAPFQPAEHFGPRRFFLLELREDLTRALHQLPAYHDLPVEKVRVELRESAAKVPVRRGDELVFTVDEKTLDAMNTDAAVLFGERGLDELRKREGAKAAWTRLQVASMKRGVLLVEEPAAKPAPQASNDNEVAKVGAQSG